MKEKGLKGDGVFSTEYYAIESIVYHPRLQEAAARRMAVLDGSDAELRVRDARHKALLSIKNSIESLSEMAAYRTMHNAFMAKKPGKDSFKGGDPIRIVFDPKREVDKYRITLQEMIDSEDLEAVLKQFPIKRSPALGAIAKALGFQSRQQYEDSVTHVLMEDEKELEFVRKLFGDLTQAIESA